MQKIYYCILFILVMCPAYADAPPCNLTAQDYASLASSDSKIDQISVLALSREEQNMLCTTRYFWKQIEREGTGLNEVVLHDPRYLSHDEKVRVDEAVNQIRKRMLAKHGIPVMN